MQAVVMHPEGAEAGLRARRAIALLPEAARDLESVVLPSKKLTSTERLEIYAHMYYARLVEVVEAEAGVADREFRRIAALNLYRNAQDQLIDRVYGPRLTVTSRLEIEPTDKPESYVTFAVDPELSMQRAVERRPEIAVAMQQVEQGRIALKFAKNERLPQLDLVAAVVATRTPTIAVALRGPWDVAAYPAGATALATYSILPGSLDALAAVIAGNTAAPGRLPVSVAPAA